MNRIAYKEVPSGRPDVVALEIASGKYAGVVVVVGKITLKEDKENDRLNISYEFEVLDQGNYVDLVVGTRYTELEKDERFKKFMHGFVHQLINDEINFSKWEVNGEEI